MKGDKHCIEGKRSRRVTYAKLRESPLENEFPKI
jgi:hypothetical protein